MQMEEGVCAILGGKSGDSGPIKAAPSSSPFQFSTERVYAGDRSTFPAKSTAIRASLADEVKLAAVNGHLETAFHLRV